MAEEKDQQDPTEGQQNPPAYSGEDIPDGELKIPPDVPQEHISQPSMGSDRIEKAPKKVILKRLAYLLVAIIILAAAGIVAWKLVPAKQSGQKPSAAASEQNQNTSEDQADAVALALGNTNLTETYTSDTLRLEFKHPPGWKVAEQANALMIKSPAFDLADRNGSVASTYFKIYIKQGANGTDGKYLGRGYAVAPSEKLTYANPAVGQRKTTFLTDFGLDTSDNFAYFVVQGNFNLEKGDTLGPKFASETEAFLLSGGFASEQEKDNLQTRLITTDSYKQNLAYQTAVEIVKTLQLK